MPKPTNRLCTRSVEFRMADSTAEGDGRTLVGHLAVFDSPTEINSWEGTFTESIAPGAFRKTLSEGMPLMQWDHGKDTRVGSTPIGAFRTLVEDDKGLYCEAPLFDNPVVEPVRQAIASGAVRGASFKFAVTRDEWHDNSGKQLRRDELRRLLYEPGDRGPLRRTLKEVRLFEAGPVAHPAYADAQIGVRSEATDQEREQLLAEYHRTMIEPRAMSTAPAEGGDAVSTSGGRAPLHDSDAAVGAMAEHPFEDGNCTKCSTGYRAGYSEPYGNVTYADPGYQPDGRKRYPVDSEPHVRAAWAYVNVAKNGEKYSPADLARVKDVIKEAAKKFGIDDSSANSQASASDAAHRGTSQAAKNPEDAALSGTSSGSGRKPRTVRGAPARHVPQPMMIRKEKAVPKTVEEMRARLAEIATRMKVMDEEARDADLGDGQAEWDTLATEYDTTETAIKAVEGRQARLKNLAVMVPAQVERGTDRGAPAVHIERDIYDLFEARKASSSEEEYGEKLRDNAMRAVDKARFPSGKINGQKVNREDAQAQVAELLEKFDESTTLAERLLNTGSPLYERAFGKAMKACSLDGLTAEEQRAMATTSTAGGFAVPFQLDPTVILTNAGTINPLRQIARVEQIVGKQWQGVTSAGVTVSRAAEAAESPDSSFTLAQPVVSTNRVQGFVPFSIEIDIEWGQLRSEITRLLVDAKEREEATSFTTGDGTGTNANGVVTTLSGNTVTTVTTATFAAQDLYNLESALDPRWRLQGKASLLANKALFQAVRQLDTAGGAQLWERIGSLVGMNVPALLGYPAYEVSDMSGALTTTGSKVCLLGDFDNFLIVDRIGMNIELVPQVFGGSGRPTGQRGIYAIWMNNSLVLNSSSFKLLVIK